MVAVVSVDQTKLRVGSAHSESQQILVAEPLKFAKRLLEMMHATEELGGDLDACLPKFSVQGMLSLVGLQL